MDEKIIRHCQNAENVLMWIYVLQQDPGSFFFFFPFENRTHCEFSQVFIFSEDVKHLKAHNEHLRKICFPIKFHVLESRSSDNLPLERPGGESELEAGFFWGKNVKHRELQTKVVAVLLTHTLLLKHSLPPLQPKSMCT